ncbi:hypothetical protein [Hydrogenophaga sp. PAMC20947]|uniref:hypothetical protein n=1 Tax=Hydrogenophaga sp. PAMC20947 TaxID=2565558 RepID=UPI001FF89A3A|nr:hypothetical protein [Hydrogenophaga sp. PAMC20947]
MVSRSLAQLEADAAPSASDGVDEASVAGAGVGAGADAGADFGAATTRVGFDTGFGAEAGGSNSKLDWFMPGV